MFQNKERRVQRTKNTLMAHSWDQSPTDVSNGPVAVQFVQNPILDWYGCITFETEHVGGGQGVTTGICGFSNQL